MGNPLGDKLREISEQATSIFAFFGWFFLVSVAIYLKDTASWAALVDRIQGGGMLGNFKDPGGAWQFLTSRADVILLSLVMIFSFSRYKQAASSEPLLLENTFQGDRSPKAWAAVKGGRFVIVIAYAIVITYAALVISTAKITIFLPLILLLHVVDILGAALMQHNLHRYFAQFPILPNESGARFTAKRREIMRAYYFDNPVQLRIGLLILCAAGILSLSSNGIFAGPLEKLPYLLAGLYVLAGELWIGHWRAVRDRALEAVNLEEEQAVLEKAS